MPTRYYKLCDLRISSLNPRPLQITCKDMMNISEAMDIPALIKRKQIFDPATRTRIEKYVRHQLCYERSQRAEFHRVLELAIDLNADPAQQNNPIHVVYPEMGTIGEDQGLEVSIGQHRFLAFILMGAETIQGKLVKYASTEARLDIELRNHFTGVLAAADMVTILRTASRQGKRFFTVSQISELTGKGRGTAHQLHQLLDINNEFAERVRSGEFKSLTAMLKAFKDSSPSKDRPFQCYDANDIYQASRTLLQITGTAEDAPTYFMLMLDLVETCKSYNSINLCSDIEHPELVQRYLQATKVALETVEASLVSQISEYNLGRTQGRYVFDRHQAQACMNVLTLCKERMLERMNLFGESVRKSKPRSLPPSGKKTFNV